MSKNSSSYKVALGDKVLHRARLIFTILPIMVILILGTSIYAESKTGDLRNKLTQPFKNFVSYIETALKSDVPEKTNTNNQTSVSVSTSSSKIIINNPTATPQKKIYYNNQNTVTPQPTKSIQELNAAADQAYQDALKKQEEWSKQQQAANDKWLQEQSAKNSQASQDWFNQKVLEQQKSLDAWKKANGF